MMPSPRVVVVPGLRGPVAEHWQTLLLRELPEAIEVPPMGREQLDRQARVQALDAVIAGTEGPVVLVAHSGGCITVAHWAMASPHAARVHAALLATPPDFDTELPAGYPSQAELRAAGWFPLPHGRLPFASWVATSDDDPLGPLPRVQAMARQWGSAMVHLGAVGHLNPASGFGPWPRARRLVEALSAQPPRPD